MTSSTVDPSFDTRIHPLEAIRALRELFKNKEDTGQVFKIIDALKGKSMLRLAERFRADVVGKQVLAEQRQLLTTLCNRDYLRSLPEGSYGRTYLQFLETEGLSAEGLVDASMEGTNYNALQADFRLFASRMRDSHDLQHVLTGYGRNSLGELCVLTYHFTHTRNPGIGFLVLMAMFKFKRELPRGVPVFSAIREAYRNGKQARWIPGTDWEAMLLLPLDEVRHRINVLTPTIYKSVEPRMKALELEYQRNNASSAVPAHPVPAGG